MHGGKAMREGEGDGGDGGEGGERKGERGGCWN